MLRLGEIIFLRKESDQPRNNIHVETLNRLSRLCFYQPIAKEKKPGKVYIAMPGQVFSFLMLARNTITYHRAGLCLVFGAG